MTTNCLSSSLVITGGLGHAPSAGDPPQSPPEGPLPPQDPRSGGSSPAQRGLPEPSPGCAAMSARPPRTPRAKNCLWAPKGHRCNRDIQLNNPGPLLHPQMAFFPAPHISKFPFQKGEGKKRNKNPKLKNNRKKRRGGGRKERNCSPFFSLYAG